MERENYFTNIPVPVDETQEDAANDLTFGDLEDVRAGDDISETLWKPNHQNFSTTIQAEKEQFLLERTNDNIVHSPRNIHDSRDPTNNPHPDLAASLPDDSSHSWASLLRSEPPPQQQPQPSQPILQNSSLPTNSPLSASAIQQHLLSRQHQQQQQQQQQPQQQSQPPSQVPHQSPSQTLQPSPFQQSFSPTGSLSLDDYAKTMIAVHEQQVREALAHHQDKVEKQLQEALAAQRAGIAFDRNEFDRHQNRTRQMILSDFYGRVQQVTMAVWQRRQLLQRQVQPSVDQRQVNLSPHNNSLESTSAANISVLEALDQDQLQSHTNGLPSARSLASPSTAQRPEAQETRGTRIPRSSLAPYGQNVDAAATSTSSASGGDFQNDPRMQEIERQMAQAGLGPSTSKRTGKARKRSFAPLYRNGDHRPALKKTDRRLESMTDRDQELVFRVHLRQLESSAVYKDDYYNAVFTKKEKQGDADVFAELAQMVQSIRLSTRERGSEGFGYGMKKSKRSNNSDSLLSSSPTNVEHNARRFAKSLGTVQSWNPRAPRRVMDASNTEELSPVADSKSKTILWDDIQVRVRRSIEEGYDIISNIHDICRGEGTESLEDQVRALLATLHVRPTPHMVSSQVVEEFRTTQFFEYMCACEKGRCFLEHVIDLLDFSEMIRVMPALFANLGSMVVAVRLQHAKGGDGRLKVSKRMLSILCDFEVTAEHCLWLLHEFIASHVDDDNLLISTFRSACSTRLVFTCMQRVVKGVADEELTHEELTRLSVPIFAERFMSLVPKFFKGAESSDRVWEATGSLDGLLAKDMQRKYRVQLSRYIRSGDIPPPPAT